MRYRAIQQYRSVRLIEVAAVLILIGLLAGCAAATTGATFRSGVGDSYFERPPYAAGERPVRGATIVHLPIRYQRGAVQPALFDPTADEGTPAAALLAEMNAYLDALELTVRAASSTAVGTPPDV